MTPATITIYSGPGASEKSISHTIAFLKKSFPNSETNTVNHQDLLHSNWEDRTNLFVMPGGADVPYTKKLNGIGNQKIRKFVEAGGSYIGICAGAYYASSEIEFDRGKPEQIVGRRELGFWAGKAVGPFLAPYDPKTNRGALAAPIHIHEMRRTVDMHFQGGCAFAGNFSNSDVRILGSYTLADQLIPAIIQVKVNKGRALLSGVHFEYLPELYDSKDPYLSDMLPAITKDSSVRENIVKGWISELF